MLEQFTQKATPSRKVDKQKELKSWVYEHGINKGKTRTRPFSYAGLQVNPHESTPC